MSNESYSCRGKDFISVVTGRDEPATATTFTERVDWSWDEVPTNMASTTTRPTTTTTTTTTTTIHKFIGNNSKIVPDAVDMFHSQRYPPWYDVKQLICFALRYIIYHMRIIQRAFGSMHLHRGAKLPINFTELKCSTEVVKWQWEEIIYPPRFPAWRFTRQHWCTMRLVSRGKCRNIIQIQMYHFLCAAYTNSALHN